MVAAVAVKVAGGGGGDSGGLGVGAAMIKYYSTTESSSFRAG